MVSRCFPRRCPGLGNGCPSGLTLVALRIGRSRGAAILSGLFAFAVACVVPALSGIRTADTTTMAFLRVLSNLLGNALKFTPPGGCITLRAERRDGSLVLAVSDTGPGVAAEEIPALFARYRQTASGRKKLGTGLGLFVVKSLTEAHGGSVAVDSEVGKGTTFRIVLPAAATQEQAA